MRSPRVYASASDLYTWYRRDHCRDIIADGADLRLMLSVLNFVVDLQRINTGSEALYISFVFFAMVHVFW